MLSINIVSTPGGKPDDSGLLLSQLLFPPTWKSDVATNPKSLSLWLALPPSLYLPLSLSACFSKTRTLYFHLVAIAELLFGWQFQMTYRQKQIRPHTNAYVSVHAQPHMRARDYTIPLPECDAALNSLCFYTTVVATQCSFLNKLSQEHSC